MPQFRYRAVTHAGEIVVGEVEAPSRDEVVRRIEYLGHLPIDAEIVSSRVLARGGGLGKQAAAPARCHHFPAPACAAYRRRADARGRAADARR